MENFPHRPIAAPTQINNRLVQSRNFWRTGAFLSRNWKYINNIGSALRYGPLAALVNYGRTHSGRKSIGEEAMSSSSYWLRQLTRKKAGVKRPGAPIRKPAPKRKKPTAPSRSGPITTQRDVRVTRGSKKINRKQRRWKSFVKKVHRAETSNEKTQFLTEVVSASFTITGTTGPEKQQPMVSSASGDKTNLMLNPVGNATTGPQRYWSTLAAQPSITTAASAPREATQVNQFFKVAYANCTVSIENVAPTSSYVDIYECVAASNITDANYASAYAAFDKCLTTSIGDFVAAINKLTVTTSGATPYQAPNFFRYWKIIKKTRLLMTTNEIVNYTFRGKSNVGVSNNKVIGQYATKGVTKDLIIIANPTYNGDTTAVTQLKVEWTKNYGIKYPDMQGIQIQLTSTFTYA